MSDPLRVAAVPMRDLHPLTARLIESLDGDYDAVWIIDNGSTHSGSVRWLAGIAMPRIDVIRWGPSHGIYAMWNDARRRATDLENATGRPVHLAILNNDLTLTPGAMSAMSDALAAAPPDVPVVYPHWQATCARCTINGALHVTHGTRAFGGFAGFAFMHRPATLHLPFDEGYAWLAGDGDWLVRLEAAGMTAAAVEGVGCDHLQRGSSRRHKWTTAQGVRDMARSREPGRHNHHP